jgi:hypothetical protein
LNGTSDQPKLIGAIPGRPSAGSPSIPSKAEPYGSPWPTSSKTRSSHSPRARPLRRRPAPRPRQGGSAWPTLRRRRPAAPGPRFSGLVTSIVATRSFRVRTAACSDGRTGTAGQVPSMSTTPAPFYSRASSS